MRLEGQRKEEKSVLTLSVFSVQKVRLYRLLPLTPNYIHLTHLLSSTILSLTPRSIVLALSSVLLALLIAFLFRSAPIASTNQPTAIPTISSLAKTMTSAGVAVVSGAVKNPSLFTIKRPTEERGTANHGWLKTFHTFSFANYQSRQFNNFAALRVINEDRVEPNEGFGAHSHAEFEIFSYIVSGELEHKDSMGNLEIMKRGDVQMTSAGTGIRHSEYNRNGSKEVHFLQIWALPNTRRLPPTYYTRNFTDEQKRSGLVHIVGPVKTEGISEEREAPGPAPVHADLHLFSTLLAPSATVSHTFQSNLSPAFKSPRNAYIHVVQSSGFNQKSALAKGAQVLVNGDTELGEGDGLFVTGGKIGEGMEIRNVGGLEAEVLVFDLGSEE